MWKTSLPAVMPRPLSAVLALPAIVIPGVSAAKPVSHPAKAHAKKPVRHHKSKLRSTTARYVSYDLEDTLLAQLTGSAPAQSGVFSYTDGLAGPLLSNVFANAADLGNPTFSGSRGFQGTRDATGDCAAGNALCFPFVGVYADGAGTVQSHPGPDTTWVHPANLSPATITFTSPSAGLLHIASDAWNRDGKGGNGVGYRIVSASGDLLSRQVIPPVYGSHLASPVSADIPVHAGDTVTALVDSNANYPGDMTSYYNDSTEVDLTATLDRCSGPAPTTGGFLPPLSPTGPKSFKAGNSIPVKIAVTCDATGESAITDAPIVSLSGGNGVSSTSKALPNGPTAMRSSDGMWIYNLANTLPASNNAYTVTVTSGAKSWSTPFLVK